MHERKNKITIFCDDDKIISPNFHQAATYIDIDIDTDIYIIETCTPSLQLGLYY